jgi:iron complex outermembrane receptor protein
MKNLPAALAATLVAFPYSNPAWAIANEKFAELADLSLEQLTQITVTSASRREERLVEAPASIFVITSDDVRRSGATSIPEVLRLAPNLIVARADNNQYAISARGFNNILANKLLVLIDGRTVYTPLFSGVFWEAQDVLLDDIERIEVISGPGATLWGANAVNGVINIITKSARETQGVLAKAAAGNDERGAALRYGSTVGDGHYRTYLKYSDRDGKKVENGALIHDDSKRLSFGYRADWGAAGEETTLRADAYRGDIGEAPGAIRDFSGASIVGRVTRTLAPDSVLHVQAYYDYTHRMHQNTFEERLGTFDIEAQHSWLPARGHQLVWGGGYRHSRDDVINTPSQAFLPAERTLAWSNLFAQDEFEIARGLQATIGVKAEHNPYTGTEWLPNLRLTWHASPDSIVWGALSRAVRAPSRIDRELFVPGQAPFVLVGANRSESEVANVLELGYRAQLSVGSYVSATLFHHDYDKLRSIGIVNGSPAFLNDIEGKVSGIEAWASYRFLPNWRVSGGFVVQDIDLKVKPGGIDLGGMPTLGNDAAHSALLRSTWSPAANWDMDVAVRHVGKLKTVVPAYTAVDAQVGWRATRQLELLFVVQNAFDKEHIEWQNRGLIERSFLFRVIWKS